MAVTIGDAGSGGASFPILGRNVKSVIRNIIAAWNNIRASFCAFEISWFSTYWNKSFGKSYDLFCAYLGKIMALAGRP